MVLIREKDKEPSMALKNPDDKLGLHRLLTPRARTVYAACQLVVLDRHSSCPSHAPFARTQPGRAHFGLPSGGCFLYA